MQQMVPVKSSMLIDYNQFNYLIIMSLLPCGVGCAIDNTKYNVELCAMLKTKTL